MSNAIDLITTEARIDTLLDVAADFRLDREAARSILSEAVEATSRWRVVAQEIGLDRAAIDEMASAFEHDQAATAVDSPGRPG